MKTVNVLGQPYQITVKKYDEDEAFARSTIDGYCDSYTKELVICDMTTYKGWEHETKETCDIAQRQTLRHEIVHAFLSESGLDQCASTVDGPWSKNEEMVDWFALQGPKIYAAWKGADAL